MKDICCLCGEEFDSQFGSRLCSNCCNPIKIAIYNGNALYLDCVEGNHYVIEKYSNTISLSEWCNAVELVHDEEGTFFVNDAPYARTPLSVDELIVDKDLSITYKGLSILLPKTNDSSDTTCKWTLQYPNDVKFNSINVSDVSPKCRNKHFACFKELFKFSLLNKFNIVKLSDGYYYCPCNENLQIACVRGQRGVYTTTSLSKLHNKDIYDVEHLGSAKPYFSSNAENVLLLSWAITHEQFMSLDINVRDLGRKHFLFIYYRRGSFYIKTLNDEVSVEPFDFFKSLENLYTISSV